jgi:NTE family protein
MNKPILHEPDTPLTERPLVPKPCEASEGKSGKLRARLPFDSVGLLLQGGRALGAYQAGVYEALAETGLHPAARFYDAHEVPSST